MKRYIILTKKIMNFLFSALIIAFLLYLVGQAGASDYEAKQYQSGNISEVTR